MDPIAELLTTIRNNMSAGKNQARVSYSKMKIALLEILAKRNIVGGYKVIEESGKKFIEIQIILTANRKAFHLKRISKPGRRVYVKSREIKNPLSGLGFVVVSTPKGLLLGSDAKKSGLGGELICEVW